MFRKFVNHTEQEIKSVTFNQGSKFIRNTAICLILAVIAGGIRGWYINKYVPRFVTVEKTGDGVIHHRNVKAWEVKTVKNKSQK
jgi:membrane protein YqaA with SNARE-associated domain